MKFGETLYQRSVPQWAAYNVNYNEIKRMIKERTSSGIAVPVSIPSGSPNQRWLDLEDDLFGLLKEQHDNIVLFVKSKYGEIDRRLVYLEKQVRSAQKLASTPQSSLTVQGRRYHKLLTDADGIGQDIQNLTRYVAVQKTAFRKILKKYRKWTGSTSLQARLETEVFASGQLNLDYAHPLERLATQRTIITDQLQTSIQPGKPSDRSKELLKSFAQPSTTVEQINQAQQQSPIALDAALATLSFGKSSGSATYWIHPDNLDEAQALLLRHTREIYIQSDMSRTSSILSVTSESSKEHSSSSELDGTYVAYFDNVQRFLQDTSTNRPSKIALSARWCQSHEGAVALSNLAPWNPSGTIINIKRKDIFKALDRDKYGPDQSKKRSTISDSVQRVEAYLSEHRDVKPLSRVHSKRCRYIGTANSSKVGTWATLDSNIMMSPFNNYSTKLSNGSSESGEAFPHAVLEIRWEFSHTPELVRAFDATHLAERVRDFSLESAAIYMTNKQFSIPPWKDVLDKDIRKVPFNTKSSSARRGSISRGQMPVAGTSSGPSSIDGPSESIFSVPNAQSSSTSINSPNASTRDLSSPTTLKPLTSKPERKKKKARINAPSPPPTQNRYWNEFDDGDEDVNPQEAYTIYVDPNESFPGVETVSKLFGTIKDSLEETRARMSSMFSSKSSSRSKKERRGERTHLLNKHSSRSNSDNSDSSDSDTTPITETMPEFGTFSRPKLHTRTTSTASRPATASVYRPHQVLTPRQQALERTYFMAYVGLLVLGYMLLFISGVLLSTGRKRAYLEVDVAVVAGIVTAEVCAVLAVAFVWMRKMPLGKVHWGTFCVVVIGILTIGSVEIVHMVNRPVKK